MDDKRSRSEQPQTVMRQKKVWAKYRYKLEVVIFLLSKKQINNDLQNTTQKLKIEPHDLHGKHWMNSCVPEGQAVPDLICAYEVLS